ncbi:MAG: hypothetical protein EHM64_06520 [Ignavibacteriae bacterium]|nr:MAG: hypothetical protein EHM64_06520 [Ignavibacteriota bacterium]
MSHSTIALLLFMGIIISLLTVILYTIVHKDKKDLQRSGSFASMAALHDMGGKDEQNAIETVIEQQSDKKWKEEESGKNKDKENVK